MADSRQIGEQASLVRPLAVAGAVHLVLFAASFVMHGPQPSGQVLVTNAENAASIDVSTEEFDTRPLRVLGSLRKPIPRARPS